MGNIKISPNALCGCGQRTDKRVQPSFGKAAATSYSKAIGISELGSAAQPPYRTAPPEIEAQRAPSCGLQHRIIALVDMRESARGDDRDFIPPLLQRRRFLHDARIGTERARRQNADP